MNRDRKKQKLCGERTAGVPAIARDFDLIARIFAALAAILLTIRDGALAGRVRAFLLVISSHLIVLDPRWSTPGAE